MKELVSVKNTEMVRATFKTFEEQIEEFKEKNDGLVFDVDTKKGEKALRSHVATMRRSKKPISDAKAAAKKDSLDYGRMLDAEEKKLIGEIDEMIEKANGPLLEIKKRQDYAQDWNDAHEHNEIINREREVARREAEFKRQEEERIAKQEAERIEKERIEREERIRKEAEEKARKDAEEKAEDERLELERKISLAKDDAGKARVASLGLIGVVLSFRDCREMEDSVWNEFYEKKNAEHLKTKQDEWIADQKAKQEKKAEVERLAAESKAKAEKEESERKIREAEEAEAKAKIEAEQAERDRLAAEKQQEQDRLDQIERDRLAEIKRKEDIKAAEEKAEREKQEAIKREQDKAAQAERDRAAAEKAKAKAEEDERLRREADTKHRGKINTKAVNDLRAQGIGKDIAREVIVAIAKGFVANVTIKY